MTEESHPNVCTATTTKAHNHSVYIQTCSPNSWVQAKEAWGSARSGEGKVVVVVLTPIWQSWAGSNGRKLKRRLVGRHRRGNDIISLCHKTYCWQMPQRPIVPLACTPLWFRVCGAACTILMANALWAISRLMGAGWRERKRESNQAAYLWPTIDTKQAVAPLRPKTLHMGTQSDRHTDRDTDRHTDTHKKLRTLYI